MHSLKELYKIGNGPSSSHTMGPKRATMEILKRYPDATKIDVILYGSLALTGKGHLTDDVISRTLSHINHTITNDYLSKTEHPNTMDFHVYKDDYLLAKERCFSIGGGSISFFNDKEKPIEIIYPHRNLSEIKNFCQSNHLTYHEYVDLFDKGIDEYLDEVYEVMYRMVEQGIKEEGSLPGILHMKRKGKTLFEKSIKETNEILKEKSLIVAFGFAANEQNASGFEIVTAPTCGASGVLPAIIYYMVNYKNESKENIINALKVAGIFGNIVKTNASISGAECGCQAEIGTACSMGAALISSLMKGSLLQIESSAEIAMEHHLGLTCDPILGYVQIPCIERNATAALRSFDSAQMAYMLDDTDKKISFDLVVETMYETGKDLLSHYKETSLGGLAKMYVGSTK